MVIKIKEISAIKFYKELKKQKKLSKYKLVNGLFIVKYVSKNICVYAGDFLKKESALNNTKTNLVLFSYNQMIPKGFCKKLKMRTTSLGVWTKLGIAFKEKPIREILK